jgi:predicted metal-dependent hydrolase
LARRHGFAYRSVAIKQLKRRWGSCSSEQDIALNCFFMQLPWHLIDYVLLHELMHTRIMAHGTPFWKALDEYVPDLKTARREIKTYRPILLT